MRLRMNPCGLLSDCNRIPVFHSGFPDIPRKISAYLRTESSSGANTRIMRGFCKMLYINDLYLRVFLRFAKSTISACEMAYIGGRKAPYRTLIWALSQHEMGCFGNRNVSFRTTLWGMSKGGIILNVLHYGVFNIRLHLFRENILSKFSQEKL